MANKNNIDIKEVNELVEGRIEPQIYAFSTETIPNYLKVGDTYRPVKVRLNEWKKHFPDLKKKFQDTSKVNEELFFRDYSIHKYLESQLGKNRLKKDTFKNIYYSNEFFENTDKKDVTAAINDIKKPRQG